MGTSREKNVDKAVAFVLKGFAELSPAQQSQCATELNKLLNGTQQEKTLQKSLREAALGTQMNFGPAPTGCPCCGR